MARLIIKEIAQSKGLRQGQLQQQSEVTPQLLSRYWNDKMDRVELVALEKIAKALGVKPGDLIISDEDDPQSVLAKITAS
jgi:DNA-binding Xre family transcriptional regulator